MEALANEDSVYTVNFKNSDGSPYRTYYVEDGEPVREPKVPALPDHMTSFLGWFTDADKDKTPIDPNDAFKFDTNIESDMVDANDDFTLTAVYSDKFLVQFEDASGLIVHSELVIPNDTVENPDLALLPESGKVYTGNWRNRADESHFIFESTQVEGNITLYPEDIIRYTVYYSTEGSYQEPDILPFIGNTATAVKPSPDPTRRGYEFRYWTSNP
ncbi:MAG: InlB B-repeat-containing protein, partial [Clostridiales Family XIII bacterium]|nr:InlB B-repeat-containing protein [Clostridiales Family XIII bacterium]